MVTWCCNSLMNTIADVRRANLRFLIERDGLSSVARRAGKPDRQLNDMVAGRKSFGEKVARAIESSLDPSLKPGWLDQPIYDADAGSGTMLLVSADHLSRSTNFEPADKPHSSAHIQPARKATEPGAVIALSPAEHALLDAYRLMASADQEEIRRLAEEKAKRTRELLSDPRVHELLREIEQRKK